MRGNIIWRALDRNAQGHIRLVPVAKGAVYPYSSARQNERNARKYGKDIVTEWIIPKGFVVAPEWVKDYYCGPL